MLYSKKLITHDELMPEEETTAKKVLIGILLFAFLMCNAPGPVEEDTWIGSNVGTNIIARNYAGNYLFNSINDENGRVTSYDRQSRVLTVKTPQGNTVSEYRYDSRGKIIYYKPSGSTLWVSKDN